MYRAVLFDLDGTLTDPKEGITRSVRHALGKFGIAVPSLDDLEKFIGPPLKHSFREYYGLSEEQSLRAIEHYREYFGDRGIFENTLYGGIPELLSRLQSEGVTLAVATSKPTFYAGKILEYFGLAGYFTAVAGSNMDNTRTDKKEVIAHALSELKAGREETVMVGDRKHDIMGARGNRIDSIGVLYGYGSREEIAAAGPDHTAEGVGELVSLLMP